jgi:carbonic anhydrase/acetyltransferase-like protein (isoleucine patch superfamily)
MTQGDHLQQKLGECGDGTVIHPSAVIVEPASVCLGAAVTIEPLAVLMGHRDGELQVGNGTLIGPHAYLQGLGGLHIGESAGWAQGS